MTSYSQDIARKTLSKTITVPPNKQTLLCNTYIGEKYFTFFNTVRIKKQILQLIVFLRRIML